MEYAIEINKATQDMILDIQEDYYSGMILQSELKNKTLYLLSEYFENNQVVLIKIHNS